MVMKYQVLVLFKKKDNHCKHIILDIWENFSWKSGLAYYFSKKSNKSKLKQKILKINKSGNIFCA